MDATTGPKTRENQKTVEELDQLNTNNENTNILAKTKGDEDVFRTATIRKIVTDTINHLITTVFVEQPLAVTGVLNISGLLYQGKILVDRWTL